MGKPQVGEYVVTKDGERWEILARSSSNYYSVQVRQPARGTRPGYTRWITEFEHWKVRQGWTIAPARPKKSRIR